MKSVMTHDFSRVPATDMPRSTFDRGHGLKTAFDSGFLVPVEVQECLPGDEIDFNGKFFARLAPTVTPVMDNVFLDLFAFFVPSRIVWTNFTKMMGERVNPSDSIDYVVPKISSGNAGFQTSSLADYFGIPIHKSGIQVNALPFRAYAKIWDDWYRDENLQSSIIQSTDDLGDGNPNNINWNTLLRRGKRHDYFTSCLPQPQRGDGVNLPLGTFAPVVPTANTGFPQFVGVENRLYGMPSALGYPLAAKKDSNDFHNASLAQSWDASDTSQVALRWATGKNADGTARTGLEVDLSNATGATINSLRMAFQLQRLLEKDNRAGTRYVEILRSHFRTICPDARLQRSEFLGSSSTAINFFPVPQTSATGDLSTPQGNLVSNPQVYADLHFQKSCTEHGYLIVLANVRADLNYQQGLDRMWTRSTRYDFFWPVLQHLGEQAVLNQEIFCQNDSVVQDGQKVNEMVFGYQERYAEYRYNSSHVTGVMRSDPNRDSLDIWHLAQFFTALPKLNSAFIQDNPPLARVLAVEDEPQIIMDCYLGQKWTRPMALYSVPGLIDHF